MDLYILYFLFSLLPACALGLTVDSIWSLTNPNGGQTNVLWIMIIFYIVLALFLFIAITYLIIKSRKRERPV